LGPIDPFFVVFLFFAFHYALTADFLSGNVSLFEMAGLWAAFAFFLRKRYIWFSLLVILASLFKIFPLFFLSLLLFSKARRRLLLAAAAGASWLLIQGLSFLWNPQMFHSFLATIKRFGGLEWGAKNLSLISLIKSGLDLAAKAFGTPSVPRALAPALFLAAAAALVVISIRTWRRRRQAWGGDADRMLVFLACLVFTLLCPRRTASSLCLALLPGYGAVRTVGRDKGAVRLFILLILDTPDSISALGLRPLAEMLWVYSPLLQTVLVWALYVARPPRIPPPVPDPAPVR